MPGATTTESSRGLPPDTETGPLDGPSAAEAAPSSAASHAAAVRGLGYRPALDGLRAVAVLAVIAYHDNYAWARGGFLGVDMFFVLSGFLITTLLVVEMRRLGDRALRLRSGRVVPAASCPRCCSCSVFVAVYTYFVVVPWQQPAIRGDMFGSLFYVANWRFIFDSQGYFQLFSAASPLRHMWSLAIEEQYYLVWPLIVYACVRVGTRIDSRARRPCASSASALSVYAMRARFRIDDPSPRVLRDRCARPRDPDRRVARRRSARRGSRARWRGACSRVGRSAAAVVVLVRLHDTSGTARSYYCGGSAAFALVVAVVIAGALQRGAVASVLSFRPARVDRHDLLRPVPVALADRRVARPVARPAERQRAEPAPPRRHVCRGNALLLRDRTPDPGAHVASARDGRGIRPGDRHRRGGHPAGVRRRHRAVVAVA